MKKSIKRFSGAAYHSAMGKALSRKQKVVNKVANMKSRDLQRLAIAAGLSVVTLQNIKAGRNATPSDETIDKLVDALGY